MSALEQHGLEEISERVIIRPMLTISDAIDLFDGHLAGHPVRRLRAIQVHHHERLSLIATTPGDQKRELELHRRFADSRLQGEWFAADSELRAFVASCDTHYVPTGQENAADQFASSAEVGAGGFEPPFPVSRLVERAGSKRRKARES